MSNERVLHGFLQFWSETGTEGGYWTFFDKRHAFTKIPQGHCQTCGLFVRGTPRPCSNRQPHREEARPIIWNHVGIHILKNDDFLTIYAKDEKNIVWEGIVELISYPLFTQNASGLWIHADQTGVDRDIWAKWFFDEHPVTIRLAQ